MKYLSTYRLFESKKHRSLSKDTLEDIGDVLTDLIDYDIEHDIGFFINGSWEYDMGKYIKIINNNKIETLSIKIKINSDIEDIRVVVLRLIDISKEEGFYMNIFKSYNDDPKRYQISVTGIGSQISTPLVYDIYKYEKLDKFLELSDCKYLEMYIFGE